MESASMIPPAHSREGSARPVLEYSKSLNSIRTKITNHMFACYMVLPPMRTAPSDSVLVKLCVRVLFCRFCYHSYVIDF
jgi:hypothetical protein